MKIKCNGFCGKEVSEALTAETEVGPMCFSCHFDYTMMLIGVKKDVQ